MQVSLLRFLQDKIIVRIGGSRFKRVDVRIIAATNRNLAEHMLSIIWKQFETGRKYLTDEVIQKLIAYNWPGNVRELKNIMERAFVFSEGDAITPDCLPSYISELISENEEKNETVADHSEPLKSAVNLKDNEMIIISESLKKHNFNTSKSAQELGIARNTLYKKMEEFGIKR